MAIRTPPIYTAGKWEVRLPFLVDSEAIYTCKAIKSFDDLKFQGIDPWIQLYEPMGITREVFEQDERNMASILTLMSDTQSTVYVPDTYVVSFPDVTKIPYIHTVLSISLGALSETVVLESITQDIEDLVLAKLGIDSVVKIHKSGTATEWLDQVQHKVAESNRMAQLSNNRTDRSRVLELEAQVQSLTETNQILQEIIDSNGLLE
ncbi:MAG: bZIP transcription factor [Gammaproteobacteria bacterium]|nr:bZIP transcription factor [Gammaproteobacteria bacterium]